MKTNPLLLNIVLRSIRKTGLFLVMILGPALYAQSVDSLINEALLKNPALKAYEARIKSAESAADAIGYLPPPELGIEFNQVPKNTLDIWNKSLSQNLSLKQMIPLGGKLGAMQAAENKNADIIRTEYSEYRLNLVKSIKVLYYDIWMLEHHASLREEIINLLSKVYESTQIRYQLGTSVYSDLLLLKTEIASNKTDLQIFENKVSSMIYEMNSLLGRDINNLDLEVQHSWNIDTTELNENDLEKILLGKNPSLLKMENMIEMNQLEIAANNKELIPDLMVGGMIMRMPQGMFLTTKSDPHMVGNGEVEIMYGVMASITLPFAPWSSGKYSAKEEELSAAIQGIRLEKENMQRESLSMLKVKLSDLNNSKNQIKLYSEEVIPLYDQTILSQVSEFQNNKISLSTLIETLRMRLMKEEELAEVQSEHQKILSEIQMLIGEDI